ncbi:MAG: hypothetical protein HC767_07415, partial [Akkermansiaceae bacterium]|nr:hypothetical protein [Akkermansiaceae bacterium]
HDWITHGENLQRDLIEIPLDDDDPARRRFRQRAMFVGRTQPDPTRRDPDEPTPVTHINEVTHWWDGSQIYGSDLQHLYRARSDPSRHLADDGSLRTLGPDDLLPDGKLEHRGQQVDCSLIGQTTLMTVEGEKDDITGIGQCEAAHRLCSSLPKRMRRHHLQPKAGHYGIFNGRKWRDKIAPVVENWIATHN